METRKNQTRKITCIVCPIGCRITAQFGKTEEVQYVSGNQCSRGELYAIKEITNPTRMLTTTVKLNHGSVNRLPVKTVQPVPKGLLHQCMQRLNQLEVEAPIKQGQVLLKNLLNTGVDVIATRSA